MRAFYRKWVKYERISAESDRPLRDSIIGGNSSPIAGLFSNVPADKAMPRDKNPGISSGLKDCFFSRPNGTRKFGQPQFKKFCIMLFGKSQQ